MATQKDVKMLNPAPPANPANAEVAEPDGSTLLSLHKMMQILKDSGDSKGETAVQDLLKEETLYFSQASQMLTEKSDIGNKLRQYLGTRGLSVNDLAEAIKDLTEQEVAKGLLEAGAKAIYAHKKSKGLLP